nr:MAG TPA: hypothetical protein [Caudoviricetes sp.]
MAYEATDRFTIILKKSVLLKYDCGFRQRKIALEGIGSL